MTQRRVFLVTGLPATGKTTLARALVRDLAAPRTAPRIRRVIRDIGMGPGWRSRESLAMVFWISPARRRSTPAIPLIRRTVVH